MRRILIAAFAALLVAGTTFANVTAATTSGRWSIATRGDDASRVQLRFEYNDASDGYSSSSWSSGVPIADAGIPADRLRGPIAPVTFTIAREPGTFTCTGSAGEGSAAGQFTYAPNVRFDEMLATRGMGRPTFQQSLALAIAGVTVAFVDQVRGSARSAGVADLVRVAQHGVNPRYVAELTALGYKVTSLEDLVRLHDHGVTPDSIRALQAAGYRNLSTDELVTLRDHGITARYIGDLAAVGYKNVSADDLIALRDHGVSVAFVGRLKSHGYTNLSVRDLIRLRDSGI